jgi:DNA-binding transcriptional LysR family regulator
MQTRAYQTLVTISEVGSFAETAKRLNMTLSAVSMQMKALEQQLDIAIFDRTQRPPRLTVQGRDIAERARAIVEAEQQLLKAAQPEAALRGTIHIGFVLTASVRLLPRFLVAASAALPDARFEVETGLSADLEARIESGQLDAAVLTAAHRRWEVFDHAILRTEPLVYAVPRQHRQRPVTWLAANLPFLHFEPSSGIGHLIADHWAGLEQQPRRTIVLDGMEAIMECVSQGIGFTMLPAPDVTRYARETVTTRAVASGLSRDLALIARRGTFGPHHWRQLAGVFG